MKILHLAAAETMLYPILREQLLFLREAGCEVHTASCPGPLADRLRERDGFPFTPLPLTRAISPLHDLRAVRFIAELCRRERFRLVHTHTPKGNLTGVLGARRGGVPLVVETLHGFYFHEHMRPLSRRLWIRLERFVARRCDRVLFQNPEDVETAGRERIVPPEKIVLLGNGVEVERFRPERFLPEERAELRRRLGFPPDALVVGMVGRYVREKGWPAAWAAAERLAEKFPRFRLLGVGHRMSNERRGEEWRPPRNTKLSPDRALLLENRDDMPELYACMDAAMLPSRREGFPRALLEGAASGLPQTAYNIRGCRQAVADGETGFLVPLDEVDALTERLTELLGDENLRRGMGKAAREKAEREFDQRRVFALVKECYDELLKQSAAK